MDAGRRSHAACLQGVRRSADAAAADRQNRGAGLTAREPRLRRFAAVLLIAALAAVSGLSTRRVGRALPLVAPANRRPVPPLVLRLRSGQSWSLAQHRGRVVVINLWATWCGPCRDEMTILSALASEKQSTGLDVLGVTMDDSSRPDVVSRFLRHAPVVYPIAVPAPHSNFGIPTATLPTTLLIDRQGRIAQTLVGAFDQQQLRGAVDRLLAEPASPSSPS